ncbi:class F sortase [Nonomuraea sp. NPDC050227]|uniref:class F sortase n=1 Tax=Nonomuraea sp. NPDC050227 TaxID=3364360 RepID=UPI00379B6E44
MPLYVSIPAPPVGRPAPAATAEPVAPPTHLDIEAIGVSAPITQVGLDAAGVIEPPPLEETNLVGWYGLGPAPGQVGPAVLLGHVDTRTGPAVFARLRELRPQTLITITHSDGTSERFLVERVEKVAKTSFPTAKVYGATRNAELRNITCGGAFDHQARSYADNVIVYASLQQTST